MAIRLVGKDINDLQNRWLDLIFYLHVGKNQHVLLPHLVILLCRANMLQELRKKAFSGRVGRVKHRTRKPLNGKGQTQEELSKKSGRWAKG